MIKFEDRPDKDEPITSLDIETIWDVCDDIETCKKITNMPDRETYLGYLMLVGYGMDVIYLDLKSYYVLKKDKEKVWFYEEKLSKECFRTA